MSTPTRNLQAHAGSSSSTTKQSWRPAKSNSRRSQARSPRRSMEIPERFNILEDEDEAEELEHNGPNGPRGMQQSLIGLMATAAKSRRPRGSKPIQQDSGSDSEDGQRDEARTSPRVGHLDSGEDGAVGRRFSSDQDVARKSQTSPSQGSQHRRKDSTFKTLFKPVRERVQPSKQDNMTQSQILPDRPSSTEIPERPASTGPFDHRLHLDRRIQAERQAIESSGTPSQQKQSVGDREAGEEVKSAEPPTLDQTLRDIFQFDEVEKVLSEYPCWYLQSVLLQGYMYITEKHVCFYAYLQRKSSTVIKSGHLEKRGQKNPRYNRYWFQLKEDALSYYANQAEPYYPRNIIDLRYGISAAIAPAKGQSIKDATRFSVTTDERTHYFQADSVVSAKEWVKQLQKVIFRSHNDGDSVKISVPLANVIDVEQTPVIDFAETIKLRVINEDETFAVDEYFFTFFNAGDDALKLLTVLTADNNNLEATELAASPKAKLAKAPTRSILGESQKDRLLTSPEGRHRELVRATPSPSSATRGRVSGESSRSSLEGSRSSFDRQRSSMERDRRGVPGHDKIDHTRTGKRSQSPLPDTLNESTESFSSTPEQATGNGVDISASQMLTGDEAFRSPTLRGTHLQRLASQQGRQASPGLDATRSKGQSPSKFPTDSSNQGNPEDGTDSQTSGHHGNPTLGGYAYSKAAQLPFVGKHVTSWLSSSPYETSRTYMGKIGGAIVGGQKHYAEADGLSAEDRIDDPEEHLEAAEAEERFHAHFALPKSERLKATFFCYLHRVLPLWGKIYVGSSRFCFRSIMAGTRTKLVVPFREIDNVVKEKGFRFGFSGMVVVIRGHEEIFFEFTSAALRDDCTVTVYKASDTARAAESIMLTDDEKVNADFAAAENVQLQQARKAAIPERDAEIPRSMSRSIMQEKPMVFDDPNASVLNFKPAQPLRVVCLTIGSRGDVQPYIALCKGLLADGHRPKIATHAEFEPWVRKHGIDFASVEGDPAELMRICVENGMFTPKFMFQVNSNFRGWLDTLLNSAWTACQDADMLIESPSAMAGIHIAEALGVPYFRAFTMPWTRTRAYPHAFGIPARKMGGAYNYMSYVLFDSLFWQLSASQINRWRRKAMSLPPTSLEKLQPNKVPFLYNFSPSVVVPPLDFSDWVRVTGYWFLDEATDWEPPADLLAFIEKARSDEQRLVYIGFGSVVVSDSKAMTQQIVNAVLKAGDVRCILSKGWSDRFDKKTEGKTEVPLPPCIFQIASAPHDWLFQQIDAAVHHGGAGTTGASLRWGVPTIIKPFFGDQYFFANRVEDIGVGLHIKRITENILGRALWIATHDDRMRKKARALGEQIRRENGVETAINAIYRDMEYARTLVKRQRIGAGGEGEGEETEESWTFVENESEFESMRRGDPIAQQLQRSSQAGHTSLGSMVLKGRFRG
ncbi:hypothetical protein MBLNU230_g0937t1 [Neophaeotheca triangularis]